MKLNPDYNVLKVDNLKMFSVRNFQDIVNLLCCEKQYRIAKNWYLNIYLYFSAY